MPLEPFVSRTSRRPLDASARAAIEARIAAEAPGSRLRVRWGWSPCGRICDVKTTLVSWQIRLGDEDPETLAIYADIPGFVRGMLNEQKQEGFKRTLNRVLDEMGF